MQRVANSVNPTVAHAFLITRFPTDERLTIVSRSDSTGIVEKDGIQILTVLSRKPKIEMEIEIENEMQPRQTRWKKGA